jgi:hypothetical protein
VKRKIFMKPFGASSLFFIGQTNEFGNDKYIPVKRATSPLLASYLVCFEKGKIMFLL